MAVDHKVSQLLDGFDVPARGKELEGTHAHVAGCYSRQDGTRQPALAVNRFSGRNDGECTRGRHSQRMHRLADNVLTQHRSQRRPAVAVA